MSPTASVSLSPKVAGCSLETPIALITARSVIGSVVWGLALSTRVLGGRPRPAWLFDLHRFLGGLALGFVGVHVLAVLADSYVHFSLLNVLVPLTGDWHPLAVALGIVGLYLLLAVELTSLARTRLPRASPTWRSPPWWPPSPRPGSWPPPDAAPCRSGDRNGIGRFKE